MRWLIWHRLSLIAALLCLVGCYCPDVTEDPINCNQTPLSPANFWIPGYWYEPVPCEDSNDLEEAVRRLQQSTVVVADLIDIALLNNPSTQRTWANARAAAFGVDIAKSALYPTVTYQSELLYQDLRLDDGPPSAAAAAASTTPSNTNMTPSMRAVVDPSQTNPNSNANLSNFAGGPGENTSLTNSLNISYLLLDFGGRCASIEAAKQALYAADWLHNRAIQQVIFDVLQSYYIYSGLVALLEARKSDLKNAKANEEAASQLFHAGVKTKLDWLQAQTDLVNTELTIVDVQGQINVQHGRLANAVGVPADTEFHVPPIPKHFEFEKVCAAIEELIAIAQYQRPDLAAVYANLEEQRALVNVARSEGLPTITADINLQDTIFLNNPSLNNRSISGALSLNVPLFSGYLFYNQVRQAKEFVRAACADIRIAEQQIALDIVSSFYDFKTAVETALYTEKYLKFSEETYQAAMLSYQAGVGTILDLLSAQRTLANARATRIQALTRWATTVTSVTYFTGLIGSGQESMIKCRKSTK